MQWTNDQPIYQQVRDHVVTLIIDGVLKSGDPIPSVRQMAVEGGVNPLTVSKAYQELVDLHIVEKRRGLGMFITCLLYTSPSPRDQRGSRMPSSA